MTEPVPIYRRVADLVISVGAATVADVAAQCPDLARKQISSALAKSVGLRLISRGPRKLAPGRPKAYCTTYYRPGLERRDPWRER